MKTIYCRKLSLIRPVVVFISYSGLGDFVMALPLFLSLRPHFEVLPVIQLEHEELARLLCKDDLLDGYLLIEDSLRFRRNPMGHLRICRALSRLRPDVVLIYGKQILALAAYLGLLSAGRKIFCDPGGLARFASPSFETLISTGNRTLDNMGLAERLGATPMHTSVGFTPELRKEIRQIFRPPADFSSYVVVAPWASDPRRTAPLRFFRECIEMITTEGQLSVVVTGCPRQRPEAERLVAGLDKRNVKNLVGVTNLGELLGLLAGARFLLANDSGNLHLAMLVRTPSLIFYGPTAMEQFFIGENADGIMPIRLGLSCSPCEFTYKRYKCPGPYLQCLKGLDASCARSILMKACQTTLGGMHD
jgi:ADP-heptose:LPS heptosyltransferase